MEMEIKNKAQKESHLQGSPVYVRWLLSGGLICWALMMHAQPKVNFAPKAYDLVREEENVIQNAAHLDDFFENLYQLKTLGDRKINIVHIGDSHIQADYLTNMVRRNFQQQFGNAGRGLIVPYRVAGTNEPFNIKSYSPSPSFWRAKRCVYPDQPMAIGIGGITVNTTQPNTRLNIYMNDLWLDYSFNTVTLFYQKDANSFCFLLKDTTNQELACVAPQTEDPFANYSRVILPNLVGAITFETFKTASGQNHATIFGMNLENGKNGVLYHNIGVNGAKYAHYNAALHFTRQSAALNPDVFIISLGTNEALDYPYLDRNFYQHIDKMITGLRNNNPLAKFILVTPQDAFRRKARHNPGVAKIREQIIQYAVEHGLAFWDMYKVTGGDYAAQAWRKEGLLRPDGVHFTKDGYEYQGNLLYNALMKGYHQYVPVRHP
ncbi:MAG: GDSL-type esterase/lipase family protein [Bacteroidota bacterium]